MPRSSGQKLKILYLAQFLLEETDENHPVTLKEIGDHLKRMGISSERKSLYADLEELRLFGLDIICTRSKQTGYFIGDRSFQLPEVRLLVDAVQSSRFLTAKKSEALIKKLQTLVSRKEANSLSRTVTVAGRIKTMNESVYNTVDILSHAIETKKKIRFRYFEWDACGKKKFRRNGEWYVASPYYLVWDDENYYLVALEEVSGERRHFRVDKMEKTELTDGARDGEDQFSEEDRARYEEKTFGMFGGKEERVTVLCDASLSGVFFDRFGTDLVTRRTENGFEATLPVMTSPVFYAWLMGFGDRVEILSPSGVREEFLAHVTGILNRYKEVHS